MPTGGPIHVRFQPEAANVGLARHLVRDLASQLPPARLDQVELVVSELATNAVIHARTPFDVCVRLQPTVRVAVTDASPEEPKRRDPDRWNIGGRGLMVVDAFAQRWGFEPTAGGKTVWADFGPP